MLSRAVDFGLVIGTVEMLEERISIRSGTNEFRFSLHLHSHCGSGVGTPGRAHGASGRGSVSGWVRNACVCEGNF